MKRSRPWLRPAILATLLLALIWWLHLEHVDPRYNGRRTSEWLLVLNSENEEEVKEAELAIFILGERALPQITKFFYATEPEWEDDFYDLIEDKTGWELKRADGNSLQRAGRSAVEILGKRAAPMIPRLIESLGDDAFDDANREALGAIGAVAHAPLKAALNHEDDLVRFEAARFLFEHRQADIYPQLKECLKRTNPDLRAVSIVGLALFNPSKEETLALIRPLLKDENEIVRAHAVEALGYLAQTLPELVPEFFGYAHDPSVGMRFRVAYRFDEYCPQHSKPALDALTILLQDKNSAVTEASLDSLNWALEAHQLRSRFGVSLNPHKNWDDLFLLLPYDQPPAKPGLIFARSPEILPLLLARIKRPLTNDFRIQSPAVSAMLLIDPRFRPHVQDILFEMKTQSRFEKSYVRNGIDWTATLENATIPDESWVKISNSLMALKGIDPEVAELAYWKVLNRIHPPPATLTNIYKPKSP